MIKHCSFATILGLLVPSVHNGIATRNLPVGQAHTDEITWSVPASMSQPAFPQGSGSPGWAIAAGGHMEFDVASIKQDKSEVSPSTNFPLGPGDAFRATGGLFSVTHLHLYALINFAYKLTPSEAKALMAQLPPWAVTNTYDVEARVEGNPTKDQFRLMVQAMLADRCKLAVHFETRQVPVFALVLAKSGKLGPNLRPHVDRPPCADATSPLPDPRATIAGGYPLVCHVVIPVRPQTSGFVGGEGGRDVTIESIASALSIPALTGLDRPLVDQTNLAGTFDFFIEWTPEMPPGRGSPEMQGKPTFLEALNEQLGLKPKSANGPIETFVIDHIEQLSPN